MTHRPLREMDGEKHTSLAEMPELDMRVITVTEGNTPLLRSQYARDGVFGPSLTVIADFGMSLATVFHGGIPRPSQVTPYPAPTTPPNALRRTGSPSTVAHARGEPTTRRSPLRDPRPDRRHLAASRSPGLRKLFAARVIREE
jgi:hypothetical protein